MIKRLLVLSIVLTALGGCASMSSPVFPHRYALAVPASVALPVDAISPQAVTLRVARVDAPTWLAGTDIQYRLDYRHDDRIAAYSHAQWIAPPAAQLAHLLEQVLRAGHAWSVVLGPNGIGNADASVHVRLEDFSQHFASRDDSHGVVDATATLVEDAGGHVVAQRHFHVSVHAPSPDAEGGVKALGRASTQFALRLRRWLLDHPPSGHGHGSPTP